MSLKKLGKELSQIIWCWKRSYETSCEKLYSANSATVGLFEGTGWSKSLYAPDDYNIESYKFFLAQSDCLEADRLGQGDIRLTLTPSVIHNSSYVIMVSN
jgi:hypothetical protein